MSGILSGEREKKAKIQLIQSKISEKKKQHELFVRLTSDPDVQQQLGVEWVEKYDRYVFTQLRDLEHELRQLHQSAPVEKDNNFTADARPRPLPTFALI